MEDEPSDKALKRYWINGLKPQIKREVLNSDPGTLKQARKRAVLCERTELIMKGERERKEESSQVYLKARSANIAGTSLMADQAAGLTKESRLDADEFPMFHQEMGPEVTENVDVDELIQQFKAWQLYSRVYKNKEILKAKVLSATKKPQKVQKEATPHPYNSPNPNRKSLEGGISCTYCKEEGHVVRNCPMLKEKVERGETELFKQYKRRKECESLGIEKKEVKTARRGRFIEVSDSEEQSDSNDERSRIVKGYMAGAKKASKRGQEESEIVIVKKKKGNSSLYGEQNNEDKVMIEREKRKGGEVDLAVIE